MKLYVSLGWNWTCPSYLWAMPVLPFADDVLWLLLLLLLLPSKLLSSSLPVAASISSLSLVPPKTPIMLPFIALSGSVRCNLSSPLSSVPFVAVDPFFFLLLLVFFFASSFFILNKSFRNALISRVWRFIWFSISSILCNNNGSVSSSSSWEDEDEEEPSSLLPSSSLPCVSTSWPFTCPDGLLSAPSATTSFAVVAAAVIDGEDVTLLGRPTEDQRFGDAGSSPLPVFSCDSIVVLVCLFFADEGSQCNARTLCMWIWSTVYAMYLQARRNVLDTKIQSVICRFERFLKKFGCKPPSRNLRDKIVHLRIKMLLFILLWSWSLRIYLQYISARHMYGYLTRSTIKLTVFLFQVSVLLWNGVVLFVAL